MKRSDEFKIIKNLTEILGSESESVISELNLESMSDDQLNSIAYISRLLLIYAQNRSK